MATHGPGGLKTGSENGGNGDCSGVCSKMPDDALNIYVAAIHSATERHTPKFSGMRDVKSLRLYIA